MEMHLHCLPQHFQCVPNLNQQSINHRWGNIDEEFHCALTIAAPGVHYVLVVMSLDNLHLYRRYKITVIESPGIVDSIQILIVHVQTLFACLLLLFY